MSDRPSALSTELCGVHVDHLGSELTKRRSWQRARECEFAIHHGRLLSGMYGRMSMADLKKWEVLSLIRKV
jgi:hypothetical protein